MLALSMNCHCLSYDSQIVKVAQFSNNFVLFGFGVRCFGVGEKMGVCDLRNLCDGGLVLAFRPETIFAWKVKLLLTLK